MSWTRPRSIEGHCGRVVLLACAFVHDPIMASVCVQVPRDTNPCDVGAWVHQAQQKFYQTMRGGIEAISPCVNSGI